MDSYKLTLSSLSLSLSYILSNIQTSSGAFNNYTKPRVTLFLLLLSLLKLSSLSLHLLPYLITFYIVWVSQKQSLRQGLKGMTPETMMGSRRVWRSAEGSWRGFYPTSHLWAATTQYSQGALRNSIELSQLKGKGLGYLVTNFWLSLRFVSRGINSVILACSLHRLKVLISQINKWMNERASEQKTQAEQPLEYRSDYQRDMGKTSIPITPSFHFST